MTYPPMSRRSSKKLPVVILIHGWRGEMNGKRNVMLAEALAEMGIATLRFNMPGHGLPGEQSAGSLATYSISQGLKALAAVVAWLQAKDQVDPSRIAVCSASLGASVSLRGLAELGSFKTGILISTRTDFHQARPGLYSFGTVPDRVVNRVMMRDGRRTNFLDLAECISVPTLVIHGMNDTTVPPEQSALLMKRLRFGQFAPIEGGDHMLRDYGQKIVEFTTSFLAKNL